MLKSRALPTNKNNPCPVCGNTSGDCRTLADETIFCFGESSSKKGDVVNGFICVKGANGHTATFKPDNREEWTEEKRQDWERQKLERQRAAEEERRRLIAAEISVDDRNLFNQKIVEQLGLNDADRKHLLDRGFTEKEIEECKFRSVRQWQLINLPGCPPNFPGLINAGFGDSAKRKMIVSSAGILCPIQQDGKIVAFKVRFTEKKDDQRYSSVSCTSSRFHITAEQPLAVLPPSKEGSHLEGIWVTEGSEIKPVLINQKYNVSVLGGGRYWHLSPNHAAKFLPLIKERYGSKITLPPDAGDILNSQICALWLAEAEFFKTQGFEVSFAWWDQFFKHNEDIDELRDIVNIQYLSIEEFRTLVKDYNNIGFKKWRDSRKFTPTIEIDSPHFYFPDIPQHNAIISVKSAMGTGKTEELLNVMKSSSNRSFLISVLNMLLTQSQTRAAEKGLKIYHLHFDDALNLVDKSGAIMCSCINSLHHLNGYFEGTDIHFDEIVSIILTLLIGGTLGDKQAFVMGIFEKAVRECDRVFLYDANNNDIITDFISRIAPEKQLVKILNKALPKTHEFTFVDGLDPEEEEEQEEGGSPLVNGIYEEEAPKKPKPRKTRKRDRSPLTKFLCDEEVKPFIASDSRELTNTLSKILIDNNKRGIVVNRETVGQEHQKEFMSDPDTFLDKHQPDFHIISPTANQGVSITNVKFFTHKVTIFTGVLGTNQQTQMLMRVRPPLEHLISCPEFSTIGRIPRVGDYANKSLQAIALDKLRLSADLANSGDDMSQMVNQAITDRQKDRWFQLSMELGELDDFERRNLRKCLIFALREQGHKVRIIDMDISREYAQIEKDIKHELRLERATKVHPAIPFNSLEEANQKARACPSPEVMHRIEKTRLLDRLPDIDKTEIFTPEFIKKVLYDDRESISNHQRYYFLNNFELSQKRSEANWYYKATNQYFYLGSMLRDSHLKIWALQQLKMREMEEALLAGEELHKDHHLVTNLYNFAISNYQVMLALGLHIPKATLVGKERTDLLKNCFRMIGVKLKKTGRKLCPDGIRRNCYGINMEHFNSVERLAILNAIHQKYHNYLESESLKKIDWKLEAEKATLPKLPPVATPKSEIAAGEMVPSAIALPQPEPQPENAIAPSPVLEPQPEPETALVWHFGEWKRVVVEFVEDAPERNFFKAIAHLADGFKFYIWDKSQISFA
jgi:hypothetical protein